MPLFLTPAPGEVAVQHLEGRFGGHGGGVAAVTREDHRLRGVIVESRPGGEAFTGAKASGKGVKLTLPAASVVVLEIQ